MGGQIVPLNVSGVSGVAGVAALPPVEEEHKLLQEVLNNRQQVVVSCAEVMRKCPKNVGGQIVQLTVSGVIGVAGVAALPPVEGEHNLLKDV